MKCIDLKTMKECPVPKETVVCLGNFDGVHLAHQALMRESVAMRQRIAPNASAAFFTFSIPSSDYLTDNPPKHLCSNEEKLQIAKKMGLDVAFLSDFSKLRALSPEDFITTVLRGECHVVGAVCGFNYRYGSYAKGTSESLKQNSLFPVSVLPAVLCDGDPVSSTRIRKALEEGKIDLANRLLGYSYSLESVVGHGKRIGSAIGFPTVNQTFPDNRQIPKHGVYASLVTLEDGRTFRAISNVGVRPTVSKETRANCETHLFDFSEDLYGKTIRVSFLRFLREEKKFSSLEELQAQIKLDKKAVLSTKSN